MIGIIILNYMTWSYSLRCIKSIYESEGESFARQNRIYLVDNGSTVDMPEELYHFQEEKKEIRFIKSEKNLGYAAGNNLGIRQAIQDGCDAVLISNNDVCFQDGSIRKMYDFLDAHRDAGIVGPKIRNGEGEIQKSCLMRKTGLKEKYLVRTRLNLLFRKQHRSYFGLDQDYDSTFQTYAVLGCCFMISGDCVREVFPFDEGTFLYEEEYIVGIRMEEKGYKTFYYPESTVTHLHGKSTGEIKPFAYTCETLSEIYYCTRYLDASKGQVLPLYIYRVMKYYGKCIRHKEFREYRKEFMKKTGERYKRIKREDIK